MDNLQPVTPDDSAPTFLGAEDLARRWGLTRQRIHQLLREDDRMPRGHKLGGKDPEGRPGSLVWILSEVEAYERVSGRQPPEPDPKE